MSKVTKAAPMEAVLKCVECVAKTMPQMEEGVEQFISSSASGFDCLPLDRLKALSNICERLESNIKNTNDVSLELTEVFGPLHIASSSLNRATEKLLQSKQNRDGNTDRSELKRKLRSPLFAFHDNAGQVGKAQFDEAIKRLDSLKEGWLQLQELVEKEIAELEKEKKKNEELLNKWNLLRTVCYLGAGVTVAAGVGLSIFLIVSSGGLTAAGEVAALATAAAGTAAVAAGATGTVVGLMSCASIAGAAIKAAQKMIDHSNAMAGDYKKLADKLGAVIQDLEGLKKDIEEMQVKIVGAKTAVTQSQRYHNDVKSRLGMGDKDVTRDDIFDDLFDMDVKDLTQLKEEMDEACKEESKILSKLKEMSEQSIMLQERYVKGTKGAPSLYDHREKLQKMVRHKEMA